MGGRPVTVHSIASFVHYVIRAAFPVLGSIYLKRVNLYRIVESWLFSRRKTAVRDRLIRRLESVNCASYRNLLILVTFTMCLPVLHISHLYHVLHMVNATMCYTW